MILRILFFVLLTFPMQAFAADLDYTDFAQIPVQHEGRIKPLDTFARAYLQAFSGNDKNANSWLAEILFDPAQAMTRPTFRVLRPEILNLPARDKKYYSYSELIPAFQAKKDAFKSLDNTDEKDWTEDQRELQRLANLINHYEYLLRTFSYLQPLNIQPPQSLAKEWNLKPPYRLQDFETHKEQLNSKIRDIIKRKGEDPSKYTQDEYQTVTLGYDLMSVWNIGPNSNLLRIAPGTAPEWMNRDVNEWFSPWDLRNLAKDTPQKASYLQAWQIMATAYYEKDADAWKSATKSAKEFAAPLASMKKIHLEVAYNQLHPLGLAMGLYLLAFLLFIAAALSSSHWRIPSIAAFVTGAIFHTCAVLLRIIILSRPPVGTLYESIIFVALICVLIALAVECIKKDGAGLLIGMLSGLLLLFIAQSFAEDDTMKMLVAVLNTNFWLATHVLCITIGYGFCLIVSLYAHIWLVRAAIGKQTENLSVIKTLSVIALLFTAVGTILGGIWADQSWGRFWGWDPKENGALLIVLWLIWLIHGSISGHIKRLPFMVGIAALAMVVAMAWFGVNLLSIGLHSYGFITGVATGLLAFCVLEIAIIGATWVMIRKGNSHEA